MNKRHYTLAEAHFSLAFCVCFYAVKSCLSLLLSVCPQLYLHHASAATAALPQATPFSVLAYAEMNGAEWCVSPSATSRDTEVEPLWSMVLRAKLQFGKVSVRCIIGLKPSPMVTACYREENVAGVVTRQLQRVYDYISVFRCYSFNFAKTVLLCPFEARKHQVWVVGHKNRVVNAWLGISPSWRVSPMQTGFLRV